MKKSTGTGLTEYALILGLGVVIAIPAIGLLGQGNMEGFDFIANALQNSWSRLSGGTGSGANTNNIPPVQSPPITIISNTGNSGTGNAQGVGSTPFPSIGAPNSVQAAYNSQTGQIEFIMYDGSGAGTTATSVEGTRILAMQLQQMVNEYQTPDGEPLPNNVKDLLMQLGNNGMVLADYESGYIQDPAGMTQRLSETYMTVNRKFSKLDTVARQSMGPNADAFINEVADLSGLIHAIAAENFVKPILAQNGGSLIVQDDHTKVASNQQHAPMTLTSANISSYHVGSAVSVQGITVPMSPKVTKIASKQISSQPVP